MKREPERGVILINVLVLLGLSAAVVTLMLSLGEIGVARSLRFSEAAQALVLVRGGEQSAIAALRRDMIEAPEIDHAQELWAQAAQRAVAIEGGAFEMAIADARGLYNLNALASGGLQSLQTLQAIVAALELPPQTTARIAASLARDGPLRRLEDLTQRAGIAPEAVADLSRLVTALPGRGEINVNAAPVELIAILLQNPVAARVLGATRTRQGFLTPRDVSAARVILPSGVGFRSDLFELRVTVRIGDTVQSMRSLLQRREGPAGVPEVAVVSRWDAAATFPPPPPS